MEKFAGLARSYICTYHDFFEITQRITQQQQDHTHGMTSSSEDQGLLFSDIERVTKMYKSHRNVLDFDCGFVNSVFKEVKHKKDDDEV